MKKIHLLAGILIGISLTVASAAYAATVVPVNQGGTGRATFTASQLLYGNGTRGLSSVATSSATCSGSVSCSAFTVVGSVAPTITSSALTAAITGLKQTFGATQTGATQTLATSTPDTNLGLTITTNTNEHIFTPYWIGTLADSRITSAATWNAKESALTFSDGLTRTANDIDCDTASGSVFGCLSSADWTTFNNKQASISTTWPITLSGSTLGFGGLSTSTPAVAGNIPYFSGVNTFANVATTSLTASSPLSLSQPISVIGTAPSALSISTAGTWSGLAGTATALATPRAIYGNNFDGTAALTQIIASTYGGTGNGFTKFSGPTTAERTFTLPDASATILTSAAAVTVAQGGTGATTLTGIVIGNGTSAFTTVAAPSGAVVGTSDTQTLTNKRVNPRIGTVADGATITPTGDDSDVYTVTALAQAATIAAPSGTPVNGQKLIIRLLDNGTARALTWNAIYNNVGITLPTTTTLGKTTYVGCIYNTANTKWDCLATGTDD